MCFGSPKVPSVPQTDYNAQAQAQMQILREQQRLADQARVDQDARDSAQRERDTAAFNTNLSGAMEGARGRAIQDITGKGLDANMFSNEIEQMLNSIRGQVPQLDTNPGSYFANQNIADLVLNNATTNQRTQYGNQVNNMFGNDYANQRVSSSMDDDIISRILGEQYDPALQQVQRAFERGTINDQGFQTAMNALNNQRTTANANLQTTGGGLLQSIRDSLTGVGNEARNAASNYQLGTTFDPNSYSTRADTIYNEGISGLEGNLRNAIGGQQFFDIGSILNQGKTAQGTANNGNRALFDAFAADEADKNKQRGLGTQGVF